ncbi:MAG: amino acid racemase [Actinomycetota bacterium]|nr:amino acid racemase [Actinomycetota bacterium]
MLVEHAAAPASSNWLSALGVLGGMGPLATAHFYQQLIALTPAERDQDHLPVVLWADPSVPDRTAAVLGQGDSPVPAMLRGIRWLQAAGTDLVAVPCNTAHAFFDQIVTHTEVRLIDMVLESVRTAQCEQPAAGKVGVLCTEGTRVAQLYERAARTQDVELVQVDARTQRRSVDVAIGLVKARPADHDALAAAAEHITLAAARLVELGAEVVIAACTEIPLVMSGASRIVPMIDSTGCLAAAALAALRK